MAGKDYYASLGIEKNASADEIKSAFRRLARQYHPDVSKEAGADLKFKEINEAYQVLGDTNKRAHYDRYGSAGPDLGGQGFGGTEINLEDLFQNFSGGMGGFGDMFESFFGGTSSSSRKKGPERGSDLRYDMALTLEEAFHGGEKEINIEHLEICEKCKGKGAENDSSIKKCGQCNGAGQVRHTQRTVFGSFATAVPCAACSGKGETITNPCKTCKGGGRLKTKASIKVKIPAGIDSGYRLRISGSGDAGPKGGINGDLYVFINVRAHHKIKRQSGDIYLQEKIDFVTAILGDEINIELIDEKTKLKVNPGTQPNSVIRLKGKGMPHLQGHGRGDAFVELQVEIPTRISKEQAELLKKIKGIK